LQEAERHLAERKRAIPKTELLHPRILEWLERPAVEAAGPLGRLAQVLFPGAREKANAAVISVLTLGDIVYSAAMIDPSVIEAADFSYSEEVDNLVAFSDLTSKILELKPIQASGAISRLEGYVAEQVVAAELVAQGHQVVFPATSNQKGWDLLVDGQEFQVKRPRPRRAHGTFQQVRVSGAGQRRVGRGGRRTSSRVGGQSILRRRL
jgi:hypothetical protein